MSRMSIDDALTTFAELNTRDIRCRLQELSEEQRLLRFLLRAKRTAPGEGKRSTLNKKHCESAGDRKSPLGST